MPYKYREVERKLLKIGYLIVRQKGSHVLFSNGKITFPVPKHAGKEISIGVEAKLIKLTGLEKEDFKKL